MVDCPFGLVSTMVEGGGKEAIGVPGNGKKYPVVGTEGGGAAG